MNLYRCPHPHAVLGQLCTQTILDAFKRHLVILVNEVFGGSVDASKDFFTGKEVKDVVNDIARNASAAVREEQANTGLGFVDAAANVQAAGRLSDSEGRQLKGFLKRKVVKRSQGNPPALVQELPLRTGRWSEQRKPTLL